jgi:hypothetical protein
MFKAAGRVRDKALEGTVFTFLKGLAGEFIELQRESVGFNLGAGNVDIKKVLFKKKVLDIVDEALKEAGIPVYMSAGFLQHIQLTQFFPTDVLDGDFDYPISAKISGLVLVFQPLALRADEAKKTKALTKKDAAKKKKADAKRAKNDKKDAKEAAKAKEVRRTERIFCA